jgi:protein arginine N-methyltransferase 1
MSVSPDDRQSCDYYFDSYSHFSIHEDMLKDKVRTPAYRQAIFTNPSLFKGKVVLDAGCGTGILAMFAAKCGARKVYAIEKSSIVDYAAQIVATNGFSSQITVIRGSLEDVEIPEQVDVVLSEWMGYCLLYESMLPSVIVARDRFMKPGGTMFPSRARMYIAGIEDAEYRARKIGFWDNVYGFSYAPIKKWALLEPLVETCPVERIFTTTSKLVELDLNTATVEMLTINAEFQIVANHADTMHGFVVWFDVLFEGPQRTVELSTSPHKESTHWSHSIFYLEEPIALAPDGVVTGMFHVEPNLRNPRDQDFVISYEVDGMRFSQVFKMR